MQGVAGAGVGGSSPVWQLQRRCALSPRQFGACFAGLACVSALVAGFFWAMGARYVTAFACVEMLLVGGAFVWHALHASDGERLRITEGCLQLERSDGLHVAREELPLAGLRVSARADGAIELSLQGRRWVLGRQASDAARLQVLAGLRRAVAAAQG
jgi:uncharacterized membrane protein